MTSGASLFVILFTTLNIAACLWLIWWTSRTRVATPDHAAQSAAGGDSIESTGHVWDGDLQELNNPLPRWWLGLFIINIVFAVGYLAFYPGLGNFAGVSGWTQIDQYEKQVAVARAKLEERLASVKDMPLDELAHDANAMSTAKNLFGANCSTCHGSDARGARGFPNLTDDDWLWGGAADAVYQSVANGRTGAMPAMGAALGEAGVNETAAYVISLSGGAAPADWVSAGKPRFEMLCAACHGVDGKGNALLGAPNLSDDVWLHGGDFATVKATITNGRMNQMPAHLEMLGEAKVRLLAAYVLGLAERDGQPADRLTGEPVREDSTPSVASAHADDLESGLSAGKPVGQSARVERSDGA